jgi:3',5'-cyclic AMP phosphodiesterase CpdA
MKRRKFFSKAMAGLALALRSGPIAASARPENPQYSSIHNSGLMETIISIPDLPKTVTILHVSDSHISCDNESDAPYVQNSARMNKAYQQVKHFQTGALTTTTGNFKEVIKKGIDEKVDLVALGGDIVNYPSATAIEFVASVMKSSGLPHMYTAGNHDWHYEGMEGSADSLRKEWCEKRLKPLYTGHYLYSSKIVNGINVVMIDNSTYQVNEEQLSFFLEQKKRSEPMVLIVHIPLYMPSMPMCCGHPAWGAAADKNYIIERRERWPETGNKPSTEQFVAQVMKSKNIVGVFSGHWHQYRSVTNSGIQQHLTLPALSGSHRVIRFQPLT